MIPFTDHFMPWFYHTKGQLVCCTLVFYEWTQVGCLLGNGRFLGLYGCTPKTQVVKVYSYTKEQSWQESVESLLYVLTSQVWWILAPFSTKYFTTSWQPRDAARCSAVNIPTCNAHAVYVRCVFMKANVKRCLCVVLSLFHKNMDWPN